MAPAQYPGCSGTRNLHDNLSDLRAQVAANQRGSQLVEELIDCYGLDVVQAYMGYIQVAVQRKNRLWSPGAEGVCVSDQRGAGSTGHAERVRRAATAADGLLGCGGGGFHG